MRKRSKIKGTVKNRQTIYIYEKEGAIEWNNES
jgi:hypothetical protein